MRRTSILALLLLALFALPTALWADEAEIIKATATIDSVTVLPNRAEVLRVAKVDLKAGSNKVILTPFESDADLGSIRVRIATTKGVIVTSINIVNLPVPMANVELYKALLVQIQTVNDQMAELMAKRDVIAQKLVLIAKLSAHSQDIAALKLSTGEPLGDFAAKVAFYTQMELEARTTYNSLTDQMDDIKKKLADLNNELNSKYGHQRRSETAAVVELSSSEAVSTTIGVKYFIGNCGWYPTYDMNYDSTTKKLGVAYSAVVYQSTGYEWEDISLTLATTSPSFILAMPTLSAWTVSIYSEREMLRNEVALKQGLADKLSRSMRKSESAKSKDSEDSIEMEEMEFDDANSLGAAASVSAEGGLSVSFNIPDRCSLTPGASKRFLIASFDLDTDVINYTVPITTPEVFIRAKITNTSTYPLLPGFARCFVDGALSCTTVISRVDRGSEAKIAVGLEKRIKVERQVIKDILDVKGRKTRRDLHIRLVVTNNSPTEMSVELKDLLPVSENDEVKVSDPKFNIQPNEKNDQNILTWNLKLKPNQKIEIDFEYYIEYPSDRIPIYQ